jgi:phosphoribosylformylglycinamidine synthase
LARLKALHTAIRAGLVQACHDCSEGGIAVAMAEMCLAGGLGLEAQLMRIPRDWHANYSADEVILFSESLTRFLVEVHPDDEAAFRQILGAVPHECVGVIGGNVLRINGRTGEPLLTATVTELEEAWRGTASSNHYSLFSKQSPLSNLQSPTINRQSSIVNRQSPRVLILHANGSNRDQDAALACQLAGGKPEIVHVNQLLAGERRLADYHMLVIPGGFSYGDDLGAGMLWALDLQVRLREEVAAFVQDGRPVLGICNGFQALVKAGLLGAEGQGEAEGRSVTLTFNERGHFECRWVYLQPNPNSPCLFTQELDELIYCPVAHGEGRLMVADEDTAVHLQQNNLIALSYSDPLSTLHSPLSTPHSPLSYPANPNGSILNIAGLTNKAGNIMGLMPHPENHIFPWQHPRRHRGERGMLGLKLFENGVKNA